MIGNFIEWRTPASCRKKRGIFTVDLLESIIERYVECIQTSILCFICINELRDDLVLHGYQISLLLDLTRDFREFGLLHAQIFRSKFHRFYLHFEFTNRFQQLHVLHSQFLSDLILFAHLIRMATSISNRTVHVLLLLLHEPIAIHSTILIVIAQRSKQHRRIQFLVLLTARTSDGRRHL